MGWKLHPTNIRPMGSAPVTSFIDVLAKRLIDLERDIEVLRTKRRWLFDEAATHGYDNATVRRAAAKIKA